ncbi:hypothetical protein AB0I28_28805 [Phytomonospora sp. NPDC050363]|uniref:hypothetical protein n=1 Tax=Phytomonospora sp. NPDC050363 TaxID=3155642 RepID=UPI00341125DD
MTDPANRPAPDGEAVPTGLGSRPEHAPDIVAPTSPQFTSDFQPDTDQRAWAPQPEDSPGQRGPVVLLAAFGVIILAVVAVLGLFLVNGGNPREPGDPLQEDPPVAVPAPPFEERLHAEELYGEDWDFRMGEANGFAELVKNWDHDDCSSAALFSQDSDLLVELGCQYRIEGAYMSKDGHTLLAEQVLVFEDDISAADAAMRLDWTAYAFQPEGTSLDAEMSGGSADANKQYLIVTTAGIDTRDETIVSEAEELLHYFHADHVAVFHWR